MTEVGAVWWRLPALWIDHQLYWRRRRGVWVTKHPALPEAFRYLRGMDRPGDAVAPEWDLLSPAEVETVDERIALLLLSDGDGGMTEPQAAVNALWLVLVARGLVRIDQIEAMA